MTSSCFQINHGRRRGCTRAVTTSSLSADPPLVLAAAPEPAPLHAAAQGLRESCTGSSESELTRLRHTLRGQLPPRAATVGARATRPRRNAPLAQPPPGPRVPPRGSLLEQLARCQASTDSLISDMQSTFKSRYDRTGMLLQLRARHFHVGDCDSQFAGTAKFFDEQVRGSQPLALSGRAH